MLQQQPGETLPIQNHDSHPSPPALGSSSSALVCGGCASCSAGGPSENMTKPIGSGETTQPKMSYKEQEWLKAEGLYFFWHKPVPSSESDEPPGVESFGINIDFGDIENQHELLVCLQDCGLAMNNINVPGEDNDDLDDDIELVDLPETNAKFTAQMRNHFIHLGPGE
ncbi:hypothetical protein SCLCIDRAFT_28358 [Scleroderma citrinum Foug A]|uniref:Uncharacterized protein n=1 Tax=Scleroderma citrinum Foug A TaxID=1036808 RepID=A0A0C3DBJ9_9AGAM|nr:hypothetical protein SCLCIDRAFT_28358 [Scleroderma citrinum Foug A]